MYAALLAEISVYYCLNGQKLKNTDIKAKQHDILNNKIQLNSKPMRFQVARINQVKCNFCFEWIQGPTLSKSTLNACQSCLQQYRSKGFEVRTTQGQVYHMALLLESQLHGVSIGGLAEQLGELKRLQGQEVHQRWSQVRSFIQEQQSQCEHQDCYQTRVQGCKRESEQETGLLMDFINNLNRTKSHTGILDKLNDSDTKVYQSFIFETQEKERETLESIRSMMDLHKFNKIDDYCSLAKTRFIKKYQFYYPQEQIQKYQNSDKKIEREEVEIRQVREFGNQIDLTNQQDLFLNIRQGKGQMKTCRSTMSFESIIKNQKLSEQELKVRINNYMESKYQSTSLNRLMGSYVKQAYARTRLQTKMLELISFNISTMDFNCYLSLFDLDMANTIKLINVGLTDSQLHILLDAIWNKKVERIVLSGNKLTENCISLFMNRSLPNLKQIYLGKNRINKYRMKENIVELRGKFILYL